MVNLTTRLPIHHSHTKPTLGKGHCQCVCVYRANPQPRTHTHTHTHTSQGEADSGLSKEHRIIVILTTLTLGN